MTLAAFWNQVKDNVSERQIRGKEAAKETANQIALTILVVASLLTTDWKLLVVGTVGEILYLGLASIAPLYKARLEARKQQDKEGVKFLDQVLLVVTVAGFIVILFFGFCKHLLSRLFPILSHAQGWEVGAIGWTTLFLVYYLAKFKGTGAGKDDKKVEEGVHNLKLVVLALLYSAFLAAAWLTRAEPLWHVLVVMGIGICFCIGDRLSMNHNPDEDERRLSRASLHWADYPMVAAVFVLFLYLLLHRDAEYKEVFVAGVISCQLLISNAVFVVMEFEWLQDPEAASGAERARAAAPVRVSKEDPSGVSEEPLSGGPPVVESAPVEQTASRRLDRHFGA